MPRLSHCLVLAGAAVLLAQPALAQEHSSRSRHAAYRHHYYYDYAPDADAYIRGDLGMTLEEVARSPFYGPFGGYEDSHAAWRFPGPNQRRYFGYGWDPRYGYRPDPRSELEVAHNQRG